MDRQVSMCTLRERLAELIGRCLRDVRQNGPQAGREMEHRARSAEFLLVECREYVESACHSLENGLSKASLGASRWILEAALNLLWATAEAEEVDDRIRELVAEALRLEAARLDGLTQLYPSEADSLRERAVEARDQRKALIGQGKRLASLDTRLQSVRTKLGGKELPTPYALYRICCDAAHPGMAVWRRFGIGPGGQTFAKAPPDATHIAAWMIAAASFYLVGGAYCLAGLGDAESLKAWWKKEISPLLDGLAGC